MKRLAALRYLTRELYEVAVAMLDGSYYREPSLADAQALPVHHDPAFWE